MTACPDVIAITDASLSDDAIVERARLALRSVPRASMGIQLRDKARGARHVVALAERLREVCVERGAPLYVNDRLDVALAVGADGAHLGGSSIDVADAKRLLGDGAFVSVAAHTPDDLDRAARGGATAALVSPVFASPGKAAPLGTALVASARARAPRLRLYALGGIDANGAPSCIAAGADGVAVIRAIWHAPDPAAAALALVEAVRAEKSRS